MANFVTLSTITATEPDFSTLPKDFSVYEKEIKKMLKERIEEVGPDNPDLIVMPECSNRYTPRTIVGMKDFYRYIGDSIVDFLKPIAAENNVNIAYSAQRYAEPDAKKPFRNSTVYIGRKGEICGIYDKNHLVIEEYTQGDIAYSNEAKLIKLDFGNVATAICFDLNFDELLYKYKPQKPDLIVFSSMYHGGLRQAQWAYICRSHLVSSICKKKSGIINPYGEIIASTTNYTSYVSGKVNLDYELCHIDYNWEKIHEAKRKYKDALVVHDPGYVGSVMLSSEDPNITVKEIIKEFEIEMLDDYFERALAHRTEFINEK